MRGLIGVVAATLLAAGCSSIESSVTVTDAGFMRVINASPGSAMDVNVAGELPVAGLNYLNWATFPVRVGTWEIGVGPSGAAEPAIVQTESFAVNTVYTGLIAGPSDAIDFWFAADADPFPATGLAKVRLLHGAANAPPLDVYLTLEGEALDDKTPLTPYGYGFGGETAYRPYEEIAPATYQVRWTEPGTTNVLLETQGIRLLAGQARSVVLVNGVAGGLAFMIVNDVN